VLRVSLDPEAREIQRLDHGPVIAPDPLLQAQDIGVGVPVQTPAVLNQRTLVFGVGVCKNPPSRDSFGEFSSWTPFPRLLLARSFDSCLCGKKEKEKEGSIFPFIDR
jgi:hypothetical protein